MSEKSLDRRARMTRKILKQSLIELMKDKPIHEISIKKICETADINRSTFYHHYDSQYELFNDILNDVGDDIYQILNKHAYGNSWMENVLTDAFVYIEDHRETFLAILSENSGFSVGENLTVYVERFINTTYEASSEIAKYCAQFATAGMTSVVWQWLNSEKRISPQELSSIVSKLLMPSLGKFTPFPLK